MHSKCLTVQVRQLDDEHQEFDADLLIHFVTEVAKSLAAVSGRAKVMLRGDQLATRATETLMVRSGRFNARTQLSCSHICRYDFKRGQNVDLEVCRTVNVLKDKALRGSVG